MTEFCLFSPTSFQEINQLHNQHHDEVLGDEVHEYLVNDVHVVETQTKLKSTFLIRVGGKL